MKQVVAQRFQHKGLGDCTTAYRLLVSSNSHVSLQFMLAIVCTREQSLMRTAVPVTTPRTACPSKPETTFFAKFGTSPKCEEAREPFFFFGV